VLAIGGKAGGDRYVLGKGKGGGAGNSAVEARVAIVGGQRRGLCGQTAAAGTGPWKDQ